MQRLELSGAVRPLYGSLGVKGLIRLPGRCTLVNVSTYPLVRMLGDPQSRVWTVLFREKLSCPFQDSNPGPYSPYCVTYL